MPRVRFSAFFACPVCMEVISLNEVGTAFQLKLLSGCSRVSEGVFRLTECHGRWWHPAGIARCVQLSHSVGWLGWQRAQLARAQTARCCFCPQWHPSPIRLLFSHDCQIHSQYLSCSPKLPVYQLDGLSVNGVML